MSEDEMEIHSHSGNDSDFELKAEEGDHGVDPGAQSNSMASAPASTGCPLELLAQYARGPNDPKSPLKQFASKIQGTSSTGGGTRKWQCNICGLTWFGSITRVNAHFLFWRVKGVDPCKLWKNLKV